MKKIVLIGDSIRLGYEAYVRSAFRDVAEVYAPKENCRFAHYVFRYLHEWKQLGEWPTDADVVHWNAGLWDVISFFGDEPQTAPASYAEIIPRIHNRLHVLFPKAKIIFATSTSVDDEAYKLVSYKRSNAVIKKYNDIAVEALAGTDAIIDDLFPLTLTLPAEARSDLTHFNNDEGCRYLGSWVTACIARALDIDPATLGAVDAKAAAISADILGY